MVPDIMQDVTNINNAFISLRHIMYLDSHRLCIFIHLSSAKQLIVSNSINNTESVSFKCDICLQQSGFYRHLFYLIDYINII